MNEALITKMADAITNLPDAELASFHARFLAYHRSDLVWEIRDEGGWVVFADMDAQALNRVWQARRQ
jgi:hypothetical protein